MAPFARYAAFISPFLAKEKSDDKKYRKEEIIFEAKSTGNSPYLLQSRGNVQLFAGTKIREWEEGDGELIMNLLQSVESGFNPEGPLEIDCCSEESIRESYSEDGACMLVAESMDTIDFKSNTAIVGTAALIVGTPVTYLMSGASISSPAKTTGAIRRVCAVDNDNRQDNHIILQNLLIQIENRAAEFGVDELVVLAYPSTDCHRPNAALLEKLKYKKLPTTLDGANVEQYGKTVIPHSNSNADEVKKLVPEKDSTVFESKNPSNIFQDLTITVSILATLIFSLLNIASFMGFEINLSNDYTNRGIGSPLSVQELTILQEEEKLQRNDLDGVQTSFEKDSRQWEDLSFEERQEEGALMKIIQGQEIRIK